VLGERGHDVTLFEAVAEIGGQFNLAKRIPGKEEFAETLRYFSRKLQLTGVKVCLETQASAADLQEYDEVVLATGVTPRTPQIPGIDHPKVLSYVDVVLRGAPVGERVAVVGAGGIGFDVSEFLTHSASPDTWGALPPGSPPTAWNREWGVENPELARGGVVDKKTTPSPRQVFLLQRKAGRLGAGLGKTSGWVHRATLQDKKVEMIPGVNYERIDDAGLHISFGKSRENRCVLEVDNVVICAGQELRRDLADELRAAGLTVHLIVGADVAAELDAKRAISQGSRLAAAL